MLDFFLQSFSAHSATPHEPAPTERIGHFPIKLRLAPNGLGGTFYGPLVAIQDYDAVFDPIRAARAARSGSQPGDPAKAGRATVPLVDSANPPAQLLLAPNAFQYVRADRQAFDDETAAW